MVLGGMHNEVSFYVAVRIYPIRAFNNTVQQLKSGLRSSQKITTSFCIPPAIIKLRFCSFRTYILQTVIFYMIMNVYIKAKDFSRITFIKLYRTVHSCSANSALKFARVCNFMCACVLSRITQHTSHDAEPHLNINEYILFILDQDCHTRKKSARLYSSFPEETKPARMCTHSERAKQICRLKQEPKGASKILSHDNDDI